VIKAKEELEMFRHNWLAGLFLPALVLSTALTFQTYETTAFAQELNQSSATTLVRPSTNLPKRALAKAQYIFDNTSHNSYAHTSGPADDQILDQNGSVTSDTDCSGFVSFIIKTIARKHYEEIVSANNGKRPKAGDYAEYFATLRAGQAQDGWLRLASLNDLQPGDLIAWESPRYEEQHKGNSGHVMIVASSPGQIASTQTESGTLRYIEIPVIDSSSVKHFPPEELPPLAHQDHRDGVGKGRVRLILDDSNRPIGYWEGTFWGEGGKEIRKPTMTEKVLCVRLVGLKD
jgi:cell wall-associated NlpC family hydrolase